MKDRAAQDPPRVIASEDRRSPVAKWLFLPLRWVYKLWFALVFFGSLVLLYIPFRILLYTPRRYERAFRLKRAWAWFLQWSCGVPVRVEQRAPLPGAPYVICCNHSSYLDIIQMYNVIPSYFLFMGKYELLKWPLFNIFFKGMNIAVNRGSHIEAAKAFRKAAQAIDRGTSIALFPEGTIPAYTPRMKPSRMAPSGWPSRSRCPSSPSPSWTIGACSVSRWNCSRGRVRASPMPWCMRPSPPRGSRWTIW